MKKNLLKYVISKGFIVITCIIVLASCNKPLEQPVPITNNLNTFTIYNFLNTDTSYSFFKAAVLKSGFAALLSDSSGSTSVTVFAPNNAAFRASGIPSIAVINALPAATIGAIVGYLIVPGQEYVSAEIPTTFPNIQLPTAVTIGVLPGTTVPVKLTNFPSKRANGAWLNTVPILAFDMHFRNGVVHTIAGIVSLPSMLLAQMIYSDPQFTLFDSLIARADEAQTNPALKVDSILKNPGANLTVFAPTNAAVKAFISAASGGLIPTAAPDAVFFGFIKTALPATSAQGIVLYHIMGQRAFSVNFSATAAFYPTLLNAGIPTHPGVSVQSFFNVYNQVDSMKVLGVGNGGVAATSKPQGTFDKNAVNGVVHIIDRVLLPQ